jgi:hypothetical protein
LECDKDGARTRLSSRSYQREPERKDCDAIWYEALGTMAMRGIHTIPPTSANKIRGYAGAFMLRQEYFTGDDDVGRQLVDEARDIYYGQNWFKVDSNLLCEFMSDYFRSMKHHSES